MQDDWADRFYRLGSNGVTLLIFYQNTISGTRTHGPWVDGDINSSETQVSAFGHFPHLDNLSLSTMRAVKGLENMCLSGLAILWSSPVIWRSRQCLTFTNDYLCYLYEMLWALGRNGSIKSKVYTYLMSLLRVKMANKINIDWVSRSFRSARLKFISHVGSETIHTDRQSYLLGS